MTTHVCGPAKRRQLSPCLRLSLRGVHPFELVVGAAFHAYFNDLMARQNISLHHIEPGPACTCTVNPDMFASSQY